MDEVAFKALKQRKRILISVKVTKKHYMGSFIFEISRKQSYRDARREDGTE